MARRNINRLFLAIILISLSFIISGCIDGLDQSPEEIAKTNPLFKNFFDKYPNAEIQINHYTQEKALENIGLIRKNCNNPSLEPKEMYEVKIDDKGTGFSAVAYADLKNKKVDCSIKNVILDKEIEQSYDEILSKYYNAQTKEEITKDVNEDVIQPVNDDDQDQRLPPNSEDSADNIYNNKIMDDAIKEDIEEIKDPVVSTLYIFSGVDDPNFRGEGFFVRLSNNDELFIYNDDFSDNPHNIANAARRFLARLKGYGKFSYTNEKEIELYISSKYNLGAENRISSKEEYEELAKTTYEMGEIKKVNAVDYNDLVFGEEERIFYAKEIKSIEEITMTTGGSVYLITVNFGNEDPLNIDMPTYVDNAENELKNLKEQLESIKGTDKKIIVDSLSYVDIIYTTSGIRHGWVTFTVNIKIE